MLNGTMTYKTHEMQTDSVRSCLGVLGDIECLDMVLLAAFCSMLQLGGHEDERSKGEEREEAALKLPCRHLGTG